MILIQITLEFLFQLEELDRSEEIPGFYEVEDAVLTFPSILRIFNTAKSNRNAGVS